jgi:hypothetical protein
VTHDDVGREPTMVVVSGHITVGEYDIADVRPLLREGGA